MNILEQIKQGFLNTFSVSSWVNLLVYAAILVLFVFGLIRCVFPVTGNKRVLQRAIRSIRTPKSIAWKEERFLGKGSLYPHWCNFLRNFNFADADVHNNASSVEDYINEDTAIYGPGHAAFADAIPGLCVSLGFLGTLIGLAQGLSGFNMQDSSAVQQSIQTLIPGMKYAFSTSIVGVVASLLFTLITKAAYGSSEMVISRFYAAMYRQSGVKSVDPMNQIAIYQQEQTALIEALAEELPKQLSESVGQAVAPLDKTMREFMSVNTKEQLRFIDTITMRFAERMDASLNGQLNHLGQVINETANAQTQSLSLMRNAMSGISESAATIKNVQNVAADLLNRSAAYMQTLQQNQSQSDHAFQQMGDCMDQMDVVIRQQGNYLKSLAAMQNDVAANMQAMTAAVNDISHFRKDASAAAAAMAQASLDLRAAGEQLHDAQMKASKGIRDDLNATMDAYRDYVNQFTQRVDYLVNGISTSLKHMPSAVEETNGLFLEQMKKMSRTLDEARMALDDAVDRLYRA